MPTSLNSWSNSPADSPMSPTTEFITRPQTSNLDPTTQAEKHVCEDFTIRAVAVGLCVGIPICICNTYFVLQTGWGSGMSMPAVLIGFAMSRLASQPFTPAETVVVQTVAGAAGTICLAVGFAGVMPALEFLLRPNEGSPMDLNLGRLILWSLGTCLVGSIFSVFLRKQIILREKLRFPSGTATALLITVLHKTGLHKLQQLQENPHDHSPPTKDSSEETEGLLSVPQDESHVDFDTAPDIEISPETASRSPGSFDDNLGSTYVRLLVNALIVSAVFTVFSYFVPQIRNLPVFGQYMASDWLWALDPSPAYIGQGAIMGTSTTIHVLLGAVIAWGVLSPLATNRGWATGRVSDLEHGARGWVMWIALAVLLADSMLNLGFLLVRIFANISRTAVRSVKDRKAPHVLSPQGLRRQWSCLRQSMKALQRPESEPQPTSNPPDIFISTALMSTFLVLVIIFCMICVQSTFGLYIKPSATAFAVLLSLLAAVMAIRTVGETDFSPNSGIGKIAQLAFALIIPASNPNAIVINLLAGSMSECGAEQAGDLMQDFKTAHLIPDSSPTAQFKGQVIGSIFGAIISPLIYRLYASVYEIPSGMFQIPSAYLWIFTARLLRGQGLPTMVPQVGAFFGVVFLLITALRMYLARHQSNQRWKSFVPGGIAVAIGMYTTPSFSLPRVIGGLLNWWYLRRYSQGETTVVIISSGLILGEGVVSILNLSMASLGVPHL